MAFLPGWDSIETTARLHDVLENAGIAVLGLLVLIVLLAYVYGHRRDHLGEEAIRTAVRDKQEAIAQSRMAVAALQSAVEERQAAAAEQVLAENNPVPQPTADVTPPREQPAKSRNNAEKDPAKPVKSAEPTTPMGPRHLSDAQKERLLAFLVGQEKGKLTVKVDATVDDAHAYGEEIGEFFRDQIGWTVRVDHEAGSGGENSGTRIVIRSAEAIPVGVGALHAALEHARIPVHAHPKYDANGPEMNEIWLTIGMQKQ